MKDEIHIRMAKPEDIAILLEFEQGVISAERPFDPTLKTDPTHYYDLKSMISDPNVAVMVAECNGEIIGSGYARIEMAKPYLKHAWHAYLGFMYVQPAYRRKGVNRKIVEALKQWSVSRNITEMRLDVYFENAAAVKAYEKAGFTKHMIEMRMDI